MRKKVLFSDYVKAFVNSLFLFIKQLYVFVFFYGYFLVIALGISIAIPWGLEYIGLSRETCRLISKILLTITPILPTAFYSYLSSQEDLENNSNSSLGFVVWVLIIIYAWVIF